MMIPVQGHKNLYRDSDTGAIISTDISEYNNYINVKNEKQKQKLEIENIKKDINDIKSLLLELINGNK